VPVYLVTLRWCCNFLKYAGKEKQTISIQATQPTVVSFSGLVGGGKSGVIPQQLFDHRGVGAFADWWHLPWRLVRLSPVWGRRMSHGISGRGLPHSTTLRDDWWR
jgi:hypothetical protein